MSSQAFGCPLLLQATECMMVRGSLTLQGVICRFSSLKVGFWRIYYLAGTCQILFSMTFYELVECSLVMGRGLDFFYWDGLCWELIFASVLKEGIEAFLECTLRSKPMWVISLVEFLKSQYRGSQGTILDVCLESGLQPSWHPVVNKPAWERVCKIAVKDLSVFGV